MIANIINIFIMSYTLYNLKFKLNKYIKFFEQFSYLKNNYIKYLLVDVLKTIANYK